MKFKVLPTRAKECQRSELRMQSVGWEVFHALIRFVNVCVSAEDSDGQRVLAAVRDRFSDQRVV